jgi:hypothetical protein
VSITNTEGNVGQLLVSGGHAKIKTDETKIVKIDEGPTPWRQHFTAKGGNLTKSSFSSFKSTILTSSEFP